MGLNHPAYAGIGSRETPVETLRLMTRIARSLGARGYVLRSGAAPGADSAFEDGAKRKEIYLPWKGFNGHASVRLPKPAAFRMAAAHHPAWDRLSDAARALHARNSQQVLGLNLDEPARMVICWTPYGRGEGGTGQAIRIARAHHIPVFDLYSEKATMAALRAFIEMHD